ncbi:MAG: ferrous iron transporter B [Lachnospira sp.]|nr:ferrous iron transporter B [Lachnospira sp.]
MSIKIALAGNPNCGKTTLFNALTGSNQYVGNWPGVTVEKKEGKYKGDKSVGIIDLPGVYSLSPYTIEEVVARNYLVNERPDAVINIVDGTNIERNLYLSTQIIELGIPVVVAVNMMDIVNKVGDKINIKKLSEAIGAPVVEISALKGTGIKEVVDAAIKAANSKKANELAHKFNPTVEAAIESVKSKLGSDVEEAQKRFFAIKFIERDDKIAQLTATAVDASDEIATLEKEFDDDTESIITNERYTYISSIIDGCVTKNSARKLTTSDKIDRIVTNRILALPIFAVIMFIVYYISVTTVGTYVTDWTNDGLFGDGFYLFGNGRAAYDEAMTDYYEDNVWTDEVVANVEGAVEADITGADEILAAINDEDYGAFDEAYGSYGAELDEKEDGTYSISEVVDEATGEDAELPDNADYGTWVPGVPVLVGNLLEAINCNEFLTGLILDGIVAGVGAVLGFVPQMLVLFIFLAFLEGCGYMARIAFIMDRIFRKFGLSGKSFIPILIGTGCGVPGVMASRTIENERDRRMTIMTTTFIPCGAKLPIIALISAALFNNAWWVAPSAYFLGIAVIILSGIILKKTKIFAGDPAPFVMELPSYHLPTVGSILRSMWERGWSFIKKAGTIILLSSIIIWFGSTFGWSEGSFGWNPDLELSDSVLGAIGNVIKWIFAPLGFANATAAVATVMGLVAKEEVVGVFGVLDFEGLAPLAGYSFLAFNLLCAPCFAAIGAIKREMNSGKWTWIAIGYQCVTAYIVAYLIYQFGLLISGSVNVLGLIIAIVVLAFVLYLIFRPYKEATTLKVDKKVANI